MNIFSGTMLRHAFAVEAGLYIAAFLLITAAAPHVILVLSFCSTDGCVDVARTIARVLNFLVFGAFVVGITSLSIRRARDLKLDPFAGLIAPGLILADAQYGLSLGGPLTVIVVLHSMLAFPYYMTAGFGCIAFFASMEAPITSDRFGRAGRIAFGLACFILAGGLLQFLVISGLGSIQADLAEPFIGLAVFMNSFAVTVIPVLTSLLAYLIWRHHSWGDRLPVASLPAQRSAGSRATFGQRR